MVVGTPASGVAGGRESRIAGEWVVEGGGGGREEGGLHSSNGMREPLSNRCRGGARSPRWLLRTLMSFSLGPLPPPSPSPVAPVRPATDSTALASSSSTFDAAPRHAARHPPPAATPPLPPSALLLAPSPLFRSFSRRPPSFSRPRLSFRSLRHQERGGHDTCQSTADARSIPTDLGFSFSLSFSALLCLFLRRTANTATPLVTLLNQLPLPFYHLPGSRRAPCNEPSTNAGAVC